MKKISYVGLVLAAVVATGANARDVNKTFQAEVLTGLDIISARASTAVVPDDAIGELGIEVYQVAQKPNPDYKLFIPTTMYVRGGAGLNLNFATSQASYYGDKHNVKNGYATQIGLGWNLSSYVRSEIDFQTESLKFADLHNARASYQTAGGMLYFDFLRRYVMTGDITYRRKFVPFMGLGAGIGHYEFQGADGANNFVIAAPRAALGFNIMFNEVIGMDIMYQYQMMIGDGFGWRVHSGNVDSISNIMASFRVNF